MALCTGSLGPDIETHQWRSVDKQTIHFHLVSDAIIVMDELLYLDVILNNFHHVFLLLVLYSRNAYAESQYNFKPVTDN